jgi:hypothetical protein
MKVSTGVNIEKPELEPVDYWKSQRECRVWMDLPGEGPYFTAEARESA